MKKLLAILVLAGLGFFFIKNKILNKPKIYSEDFQKQNIHTNTFAEQPATEEFEATTQISLVDIPDKKVLPTNYHIFQTFNNCGPASLSMTLNHYGINVSQKVLGDKLRPYKIPNGDNDDKSVTLYELADEAENYGLISFYRPGGNIELLQQFISYDIPIITRTWLKADDDIGHYRVVKGFDQNKGVLIQDDSLQGKNLEYTFDEFNEIWKKYNYEFLVLIPKDKIEIAETILGKKTDLNYAWAEALENSESEITKNPQDIYAIFNKVVALYNLEMYEEAVSAFESIENRISTRTLWYQQEPIKAYYELGEYEKALVIIDNILSNGNRAASQLYIIQGDIFYNRGNMEAALNSYEKAVYYNTNLEEARDSLAKIERK